MEEMLSEKVGIVKSHNKIGANALSGGWINIYNR